MTAPVLDVQVTPEAPVTAPPLEVAVPRKHTLTWRTLGVLAAGIAAVAVGVTLAVAGQGYSVDPADTWPVGVQRGDWVTAFDGYGHIAVEPGARGDTIAIAPLASRKPDETHAGLVTSTRGFGDVEFDVPVLTKAQLRRPHPNPWEVAWVLWDYTDNTHFTYAALKPNGWEIGEASPAGEGNQRILATGSSPRFAVGQWHQLRVRKFGPSVSVWANGRHLSTFRAPAGDQGGRIGLYTEDADTRFGPVHVHRPATPLAPPSS